MKAFILSLLMVSMVALPGRLSAFSAGSNTFATSPTINTSEGYSSATNLTSFTVEPGEPSLSGGAGHTAWWRWTAPSSGFCTVDTRRGATELHAVYDTLMGVYTGDAVDHLTTVATVDDYNSSSLFADSLQASAVFYAQAGVTYHIKVDGWGAITADRYIVMLNLRHVALQRSIQGAVWRSSSANAVKQAGSIQITTTGTGALTGRFRIGTRSYSLAGAYGTDGLFTASFIVPPTPGIQPEPPITLVFSGAGYRPFQITSGSLGRTIMGYLYERKVFSTRVPAPFAGRFTAGLSSLTPLGGHGFVTLTVANSGLGQGVMVLPDGATATFSSYANSNGINEYHYVGHSLRNSGKGLVNFDLTVYETGAIDEVAGGGLFIRPEAPSGVFFPGGYTSQFSFQGGTWIKPAIESRALNFLNDVGGLGKLSVEAIGGEIASDFDENLSFGTDNKFVFVSDDRRPSLVLNQTTGVLTGSINEPSSPSRKRSLRGVLYRSIWFAQTRGVGQVSGTTRTQPFTVTKR
jgi:hypothetical protein